MNNENYESLFSHKLDIKLNEGFKRKKLLYNKAKPNVVIIIGYQSKNASKNEEPIVFGSGVLIDENGTILTIHHVVSGGKYLNFLEGEKEYDVEKVIKSDVLNPTCKSLNTDS